ncbi:glutaredoxin [Heterobasidion irregulare TC 32-1]|uniref:glutathione peroxidase n=1 Tax=Heterobasidion irregulare (strain TC 32-1) TaxID=747525 RepID=W4KLM6_HETIT|nr:glutaredoxin [Heterobasidion irregulare TC 32-1]ETW86753.1 glutaredoxin [Heterobasidion irregulare TC 32-1]
MAVKDFVNDTIAQNQVTIFSKSWCPYCKRAKGLFASDYSDVKVKVIELDERDDGDAIQAALLELTGQRTVPNVFINKKHVGGSDAVYALHAKDGVAPLLA